MDPSQLLPRFERFKPTNTLTPGNGKHLLQHLITHVPPNHLCRQASVRASASTTTTARDAVGCDDYETTSRGLGLGELERVREGGGGGGLNQEGERICDLQRSVSHQNTSSR